MDTGLLTALVNKRFGVLQKKKTSDSVTALVAGRQLCVLGRFWSLGGRPSSSLRLSAFMDLYIYSLYVLVSKILFSIINSSAPIHPIYILYPLYLL
jgi:hypothetical protein